MKCGLDSLYDIHILHPLYFPTIATTITEKMLSLFVLFFLSIIKQGNFNTYIVLLTYRGCLNAFLSVFLFII